MLDFDKKPLEGMTFIDLFAGIGGFRLALESLGGKCVYSSEWEPHAQDTYEKNFGERPAGDITQVPEKTVPEHNIICAGFPCFPAGTPIITDAGTKPIEEIREGDMVLTHEHRFRRVLATGMRGGADTVVLRDVRGVELECTPEHPIWSMDQSWHKDWTEAQNMKGLDWCDFDPSRSSDDTLSFWFNVMEVSHGRHGVDVYNMEVEEDNSYTANGIVVHNCQAFSISGRQRGFGDTRGTLFFDVARIVREKKPEVVFMENVKNFASHDHGNTIKVIEATMRDLGYTFDYAILNAVKFGAPTMRERCYMVCFREDLGLEHFKFPADTGARKHVKDILISPRDPKYGKELDKLVAKRSDITYIRKDIDDVQDKPVKLGTVGKGRQGERIYSKNGVAITLSAHGGGCFSKTGGYLVDGKARKLHPRECARVMGFPDTYEYNDSWAQAYQQFGNSVVVDVLQRIAFEIGEQLAAAKVGKKTSEENGSDE